MPSDSSGGTKARADLLMETIDLLATIYKPEGVGIWLLAPHKQFGGRSAWQVIKEDADGLERVNGHVQGMADGVFV